MGAEISGQCQLIEGTQNVSLHIDFKLFEAGGGSCGANEQSASDSLDLIVSPGVQSFPGTYVRDSDNCWSPFPNSCPNELQSFSNSGTITNDVAD